MHTLHFAFKDKGKYDAKGGGMGIITKSCSNESLLYLLNGKQMRSENTGRLLICILFKGNHA